MSTKQEKIQAQESAFKGEKVDFRRHLIGPIELAILLNAQARADAAEKVCAEFRAAIELQQEHWGIHYCAQKEIKAALSSNAGRSCVSLNGDLVKELETTIDALNKAGGYNYETEYATCCHCKARGATPSFVVHSEGCVQPIVDAALSRLSEARKEAGL